MSQNIKAKFLIIGSFGQVASAFKEIADERFYFDGRPEFDIQNEVQLKQVFAYPSSYLVINCAAYTAVNLAESEVSKAYSMNAEAVKNLALQCKIYQIPLIHISTDYIFDSALDRPYLETDEANPLSGYGKSKLAGENFIREILPEHIILRCSWFFSEYRNNFIKTIIKLAETKDELTIVSDPLGCPTSANNIALVIHKIVDKIMSRQNITYGIYNYTDSSAVSWYEFACEIFKLIETKYHKKIPIIKPILLSDYKSSATRPLNCRLDCSLIERNLILKARIGVSNLNNV